MPHFETIGGTKLRKAIDVVVSQRQVGAIASDMQHEVCCIVDDSATSSAHAKPEPRR
jgi:hypothetical protein